MNSNPDMTFDALWSRWPWKPIRHCPGRFVLPFQEGQWSFEELLGRPCAPHDHDSPLAPDRVLVWPLIDGGLISYLKPDGRLLHTLNTHEGFIRKLTQLGITGYGTSRPPQ